LRGATATKQSISSARRDGLLRSARNDDSTLSHPALRRRSKEQPQEHTAQPPGSSIALQPQALKMGRIRNCRPSANRRISRWVKSPSDG
jgi:hypothetical protein